MPIVHTVTFTFAPDVDNEVVPALSAALNDLAPHSKAIRYYHGADIGVRDGNAHYAVTAIFEDQQTFEDYLASPEHQQVIRDRIKPYVVSRSAVQFHVDRFNASRDESATGSAP